MYAIVKTGGKQYRVERGQRLLIERLAAGEGSDVALEPLLYRSEETVFDKDGLQNVKVTAKVLAHVRGEKLRVFKFKPKRGYKRRTGHRQDLTQIEVTAITAERAKPRAAREPAPPAQATKAPGAEAAQAKSAEAPKAKKARTPKAKGTTPQSAKTKRAEAPKKAASPRTPKAKEKPDDGS
jgi:large subunit ribosomal protein L21